MVSTSALSFAAIVGGYGAVLSTGSSLRIINGSQVSSPSHAYPFFALPTSGLESDSWLGCGASIISPTFALSSAHCFGGGNSPCQGPSTLAVWVGDVNLHNFAITPKQGDNARHFRAEADVICSHLFDGKCSHGNDIALLRLRTRVPDWVTPVPLNLEGAGGEDVDSVVKSMGFGVTERSGNHALISTVPGSELREVSVTVLSQDAANCRKLYDNGWGCSDDASEEAASNLDHQLCAGALPQETERDTCSGDSGGPMIDSRGVQVGIVSYGGGPQGDSGPGRECGDRDFPGIYARVSAFKDFIREHVDDLPEHASHGSKSLVEPHAGSRAAGGSFLRVPGS